MAQTLGSAVLPPAYAESSGPYLWAGATPPIRAPEPAPEPYQTPPPVPVPVEPAEAPQVTIKPGSSGLLTRKLQEALAGAGYSPGPIDGIYGPKTRAAVIRFQQAKGLTPDGIAGPATWQALRGPARPVPLPVPVPAPAPASEMVMPGMLVPALVLFGGMLLFSVFPRQGRRR